LGSEKPCAKAGAEIYWLCSCPDGATRDERTSSSWHGAPSFLTVAEVAAMLRVSKMTVYRMVHSGDLPAMQVGRSFRVPERAVHDYLAAGLGDWGHDASEASGS